MLKSRAQLKSEAKALLGQHFGQLFVVTFLPLLIVSAASMLILGLVLLIDGALTVAVAASDVLLWVVIALEVILYPLLIFALGLGSVCINIGVSYTLLDFIRTRNPQVLTFANAFQCFRKGRFFPLFKLGFFRSLYLFLWGLIPFAGPIIAIIKTYAYEQTFFLYKDNANKSLPATDYIAHSRQLMEGHKGDRFVLDLSFIGWGFLASITAGIANIWVLPYYLLTIYGYYNNLLENVIARQSGQTPPPQPVQPEKF